MRGRAWLALAVAALVEAAGAQGGSPAASLYVATDGNDSWTGRLDAPNPAKTDGPFATLERARDEIRKMKKARGLPKGGVAVELRGGIYERSETLELTKDDAGSAESPIVYRARKGELVRLVGGKVVRGWRPVSDPAVLNRLNGPACSAVLQADLRAQGITDLGIVARRDPRKGTDKYRLELFFQDKPMTLARWPNEGFVRMTKVLGKTERDVRGTKGCAEGIFEYDGDRPRRWVGERDAWVHGYWFWDWSDQRHRVKSIDTERRVIEVMQPYHHYGYRKGKWYYALNILAEIDEPGEWYLDRDTGVLYFWPPGPITQGRTLVSVLPTLVHMQDVSYVTIRGLLLECMRSTAIVVRGGTQNHVVGCTIRNGAGGAVSVSNATNSGVYGCDIYDMGGGGISLWAGDRKALTPGHLYAENNHIHHYGRWNRMYQKAVGVGGVGNRVAHNLMHNAPHQAIGFGGNDHVIEFNEIHSVCYESNDAGAMYSGRNWTMRGTVIRHNYLHHISGFEGRGCVGVYLDDMFCGTTIYGNVFYKVTRAAFIGGGRDCVVENNIFVDCPRAMHADARALGWAHACADRWIEEGRKKGTLSGVRYREPPYSIRYPKLPPILDENPKAPCGNVVRRNVFWRNRWNDINGKAKPLVKLEDNLIDEDPHLVDEEHMNFQLRDDSPAYKLGFKRVPIEKIGLYQDERRASWPVEHTVRPMPPPPPPRKRPGRKTPPPVFKVQRAAATVQVDGVISPAEWGGADQAKAMLIQEGIYGEKLKPRSWAWLGYDDQNLYVAVLNEVDPTKPLRPGPAWGQDDAVELAVRNPAAGKNAPILILRGYPNGHFESSDEAGAPAAAVRRAGNGSAFAAKVVDAGHWAAEFRIAWAGLGIDPSKHQKLKFNISVRKTAEPLWLMWYGTCACTWEVDNAGFIVLVK